MVRKNKKDFAPHVPPEAAPPCHMPGCCAQGVYKAPKSRDELHDYRWFCLDHIREHNAKWDFFEGLGSDEIESFIKDAVTGHRPTWNRENRVRQQYHQLHDALYEFLNVGAKAPKPAPPLPTRLRKALSAMDMSWPYTVRELKVQYRAMVKKHHPDVNKGDKKSEETFKQITAAYRTLSEHLKNA